MRKATILPTLALSGLLAAAPPGEERPGLLAWPAGPLEVRVSAARAIDPASATGLVGRSIAFAERGKAGPPPGKLSIAAARLADEGRTLVLATDPHPREAVYRLSLPTGHVLEYDLSGVEAAWDDGEEGSSPAWSGWWPHLDTKRVRERTAVSVEHLRELGDLERPGRLTLRTLLTLPRGKATVSLRSGAPFEATLGGEQATSEAGGRVELATESTGEAVELLVTLRTGEGGKASSLALGYRTEGGERPIPDGWLMVPWAPAPPPPSPEAAKPPYDLAGGDPSKGEQVFFGEEAKCSTCHKVRGRGGDVGPDLTDLAGHDRAEVYRAIAEPSAEIRPEYVPFTVITRDGGVAVGVVRAEGADAVRVLDNAAQATTIKKGDIEELRPSGTSIMPVGLAGALGEARMRDLIAFLVVKDFHHR